MLSLTLQFQHCCPSATPAPGHKRWQSTPPSKALDAFGGVCLAYAARCRALDLEQTLKQLEPLLQLGAVAMPQPAVVAPSRSVSTTHPQSFLQHQRRSSALRDVVFAFDLAPAGSKGCQIQEWSEWRAYALKR